MPARKRSRSRPSSWRPTTRPTSPERPSSSTAASPPAFASRSSRTPDTRRPRRALVAERLRGGGQLAEIHGIVAQGSQVHPRALANEVHRGAHLTRSVQTDDGTNDVVAHVEHRAVTPSAIATP